MFGVFSCISRAGFSCTNFFPVLEFAHCLPNYMKNTLPLLLLFICALGCNRFGPDTGSTTNSNSASNSKRPPATLAKVIDLPATIGKTKDELKAMVSGTPTHEDPWLEYTLETSELTFMFDTKTKKASDATLKFKRISFGDASISGTDTAEQLATMAGVDIKGKTPTSTSPLADTYDQQIGGKKGEVVIYHTNGKYDTVMIHAR